MKYVIFFTITFFFIVGFLYFNQTPEITNYPSSGETIVAFGDSLVAGVGATPQNDLVSKLQEAIGQPIINLGESGGTTADGLNRINLVIAQNPKVVVLLLGGNDAIQNIPIESTRENLATMIEEIQSAGAVVVLLGVRGGILRDGYKNMYEELANKYKTAYVPDVLSGVFGRTNLMSDLIHPNDAGYQKISDRVAPVLESVID